LQKNLLRKLSRKGAVVAVLNVRVVLDKGVLGTKKPRESGALMFKIKDLF